MTSSVAAFVPDLCADAVAKRVAVLLSSPVAMAKPFGKHWSVAIVCVKDSVLEPLSIQRLLSSIDPLCCTDLLYLFIYFHSLIPTAFSFVPVYCFVFFFLPESSNPFPADNPSSKLFFCCIYPPQLKGLKFLSVPLKKKVGGRCLSVFSWFRQSWWWVDGKEILAATQRVLLLRISDGCLQFKKMKNPSFWTQTAECTKAGKFVVLSLGSCALFWFSFKAVRSLGWKCIKVLFWGQKKKCKKKSMPEKQERGRIKPGLESLEWAARGPGIAWCPSEARLVFLSAASARKQSQVTDVMLITPGSPPFRSTEVEAGLCGDLAPSLLPFFFFFFSVSVRLDLPLLVPPDFSDCRWRGHKAPKSHHSKRGSLPGAPGYRGSSSLLEISPAVKAALFCSEEGVFFFSPFHHDEKQPKWSDRVGKTVFFFLFPFRSLQQPLNRCWFWVIREKFPLLLPGF